MDHLYRSDNIYAKEHEWTPSRPAAQTSPTERAQDGDARPYRIRSRGDQQSAPRNGSRDQRGPRGPRPKSQGRSKTNPRATTTRSNGRKPGIRPHSGSAGQGPQRKSGPPNKRGGPSSGSKGPAANARKGGADNRKPHLDKDKDPIAQFSYAYNYFLNGILKELSPIGLQKRFSTQTFEEIQAIGQDYARDQAVDLEFLEKSDDETLDAFFKERKMEIDLAGQKLLRSRNICKQLSEAKVPINAQGVLDLTLSGDGFIFYTRDNYTVRPLIAYVPKALIEAYKLKKGQLVCALSTLAPGNDQLLFAFDIASVMQVSPDQAATYKPFNQLEAHYPSKRILLENGVIDVVNKVPMRAIDLLTPIGFGQRALIVAPPRTGKTVLMQGVAQSIVANYPESYLMVLLIDERPEEVGDFRQKIGDQGEVLSSTFDKGAQHHMRLAELIIEKARRMVEAGRDVVILLDSITRLARAYNGVMSGSGKTLSGGLDANALYWPKRFFGAARNIEGGGSLTIVATALIGTGSRMDDIIFEEFKGAGNMELHLDGSLVEKRIFPAINPEPSATRKEELIYHKDEMAQIHILRRAMASDTSGSSMELFIKRLRETGSNAEFLLSLTQ